MTYSTELANMVKQYYDQEEWHYEFKEEHGFYTGGINIGGKLKSVHFLLSVKEDYVINYTQMDLRVDEDTRQAVSEYLTRANYGLNLGCFEMDFSDGEVRYRMVTWKEEMKKDLDNAMSLTMIIPCKMFERYGDGLLAVMFGVATPEEAIAKAEKTE
ncbi:MAG: YbjN domain-containing protein [Thermoguttaceae bacterium]|nr:YbjN domain-containing protein [Thermoguttaceae bacterium]